MALHPDNINAQKISPVRSRPSISQLPSHYAQAIVHPSAQAFARMAEYSSWGLVWLQIAILTGIPLLLGLFRIWLRDHSTGPNTDTNAIISVLGTLTVGASIVAFILKALFVPIFFFVGVTVQYMFARAFGGRGHYRDQSYATLLYQVPLAIIGGAIITVFVALHFSTFLFGTIISIVLFFYAMFINIPAIMGVHRLSQSKAIASVVIPYVLAVLLCCGGLLALANYITSALRGVH